MIITICISVESPAWTSKKWPALDHSARAYANCINTSGFCSAIRNKAIAGPLGLRLPCSQSWTVRKLTPINPAKADCDNFNLERIICGGAGAFKAWTRKTFVPALYAFTSRMPSRISWPISRLDIFYFLCDLTQNMSGDIFYFIWFMICASAFLNTSYGCAPTTA